MSLRTALTHVEQPRRRPAAAAGRHSADRAVREGHGRRRRARACRRSRSGPARSRCSRSRPLTRAFANHGLVPRPIARSPRRGHQRPGSVHERAFVRPRDQRHHRVPDVDDAGGRHQRGHGGGRPARSASRCRPRARPARPTISTTRGSSATRRALVAGVWVGFDQPRTILPNGFAAEVAVPMWARFMKAATHADKPQWLPMPPDITTVNVCRLSGKLATSGCEHLDVVDGHIDHQPAVYAEYFARGTEPTAYCDLHSSRGVIGVLASIFRQRAAASAPQPWTKPPAAQPVVANAAPPAAAPRRRGTAQAEARLLVQVVREEQSRSTLGRSRLTRRPGADRATRPGSELCSMRKRPDAGRP